jgi:hypothetical protein
MVQEVKDALDRGEDSVSTSRLIVTSSAMLNAPMKCCRRHRPDDEEHVGVIVTDSS